MIITKVAYFSDPKSWMQITIMENGLQKFNSQVISEKRKVILFLGNATAHSEALVGKYSKIKVVFLSMNTTSRLQPLDAGIIQSFKVKYRKQFMRCVFARINNDLHASKIAKAGNEVAVEKIALLGVE